MPGSNSFDWPSVIPPLSFDSLSIAIRLPLHCLSTAVTLPLQCFPFDVALPFPIPLGGQEVRMVGPTKVVPDNVKVSAPSQAFDDIE